MFLKVYGLQGLIIALFWRTFKALKRWLKFDKTNGNNSLLSKAANAGPHRIKRPKKVRAPTARYLPNLSFLRPKCPPGEVSQKDVSGALRAKNLNFVRRGQVKKSQHSQSDEVIAMTIEAETLVQLAEALQHQGLVLVCDVNFIRAPYRHNHRWVCRVE